jgi:hypothetical protein
MKSLNTKLAVSAFGIVAMLTSPAFAQKRHHVTPANQSAVYNVIPGYDESGGYNMIPGYGESGGVVGIPNPDRYGIQSQR